MIDYSVINLPFDVSTAIVATILAIIGNWAVQQYFQFRDISRQNSEGGAIREAVVFERVTRRCEGAHEDRAIMVVVVLAVGRVVETVEAALKLRSLGFIVGPAGSVPSARRARAALRATVARRRRSGSGSGSPLRATV